MRALQRLGGDPDWGRTKNTLRTIQETQDSLNSLLGTLEGEEWQAASDILTQLPNSSNPDQFLQDELGRNPRLKDKYDKLVGTQTSIGDTVSGTDIYGNPVTGKVSSVLHGNPVVDVNGRPTVVTL